MHLKVTASSTFRASVTLPSSKSISNRVLMIRELMHADFRLSGLADCDDTKVLQSAFLSMKSNKTAELNLEGSGTAMRFLTAFAAMANGEFVLTGNKRMQERPIAVLVDALRELGADIQYLGNEGFPPLKIKGGSLKGRTLSIRGNVSSQYVSALLMIAPMLPEGLKLTFTTAITSRPYIDLTMSIMRQFGAKVEWTADDAIAVAPVPYSFDNDEYCIEADWTAASYWYSMFALSNDEARSLDFTNLPADSMQGDAIVPQLFRKMQNSAIFAFNFADNPDLVQTLAVCCCALGKSFVFTGLDSLRIKETDRIHALQTELCKLGFDVKANDNVLTYGACRLCRTHDFEALIVDTYGDHRMAMAFAPLALVAPYIIIRDAEVVGKSYPTFWQDLSNAGFAIEPIAD